MISKIKNSFQSHFGHEPELWVHSPGRINLIGEHTDYHQGFVMPAAIEQAITFAFKKRDDRRVRLLALDLDEKFETRLPGATERMEPSGKHWPDYVLGVIEQISRTKSSLSGFDCAFASSLPQGAGLSSSAALECGTLAGLNELHQLGLPSQTIALMGQAAENQFVGVNCGIMDQFANMHGKKDSLMMLDCRDLSFEYLPFKLNEFDLLLCDTGVKHSLASSEYNLRRKEGEEGLRVLQKHFPLVQSLRDANLEQLESIKAELDNTAYRRSRYVIEEIKRVSSACVDLKKGDLRSFGKKMNETHKGLSQEYEVSCLELDFLVNHALNSGAAGSRMMGGGFGGCTINLIPRIHTDMFRKTASDAYLKAFGRELKIYEVSPSEGTHFIKPN